MEGELLKNMIVIVATVYLLKTVFEFVSPIIKRKNGTHVDLNKMAGQNAAMHEWLKPTPDGRQEWKSPGLSEAINNNTEMIRELTTAMASQTTALSAVVANFKDRPCIKDRS